MKTSRSELQGFIAGLLHDSESETIRPPGDLDRLAELLRTSPGLRAEYVQQMRLDALLRFAGGNIHTSPNTPAVLIPQNFRRQTINRDLYRRLMLTAAMLMTGLAMTLWPSFEKRNNPGTPTTSAIIKHSWTQDLPPLIDESAETLNFDNLISQADPNYTDFLLPTYLRIQIP